MAESKSDSKASSQPAQCKQDPKSKPPVQQVPRSLLIGRAYIEENGY